MPDLSVAVIGSFRQHYDRALEAVATFRNAGWSVTSPHGTPIVEPGVDFVRFESDDPDLDDAMVQTLALHRIARADLVYVVVPDGYVGRTTCYEIGRVVQAGQPTFFSQQPTDLPITVPLSRIASAATVAASRPLRPMFADEPGRYADWERRLISRDYLLD